MTTEKLIHDFRFIIEAGARANMPKPVEPPKQVLIFDEMHVLTAKKREAQSLLSRLSAIQLEALDTWSRKQPRTDGVVDLMAWPGWSDLLMLKILVTK